MSQLEELLEKKIDAHCKRKKLRRTKLEDKYHKIFERQAMFVGNGIYKIGNLHSTDTRELMLMFIAQQEQIVYEKKEHVEIEE